jgi:hypothetical protein
MPPPEVRADARRRRRAEDTEGHGIMSPHPVIIEGMESEADWDALLQSMHESCAPVGVLEEELVDRLAYTFWRLRRAADHETTRVNVQVHSTERDLAISDAYAAGTLSKGELPEVDPRKVAIYQHMNTVPSGSTLDNVIRYETFLHRLWIQTLHELEALQARRRGERTPLSRFDFSGSPPDLGPRRSTPSLGAALPMGAGTKSRRPRLRLPSNGLVGAHPCVRPGTFLWLTPACSANRIR